MNTKIKNSILLITILLLLSSCTLPSKRKSMVEYYSIDDHYISFIGKITKVFEVNSRDGSVDVRIEQIDNNQEIKENEFNKEDTFMLTKESYQELLNNAFELVESETYYIFTSAEAYFYDDFSYPIVEIKDCDNQTMYLSFETGKNSYINYVKNIMF